MRLALDIPMRVFIHIWYIYIIMLINYTCSQNLTLNSIHFVTTRIIYIFVFTTITLANYICLTWTNLIASPLAVFNKNYNYPDTSSCIQLPFEILIFFSIGWADVKKIRCSFGLAAKTSPSIKYLFPLQGTEL